MGPQTSGRKALPTPLLLRQVRAGRQVGEVGGAIAVVGSPVRVDGQRQPNQKQAPSPVEVVPARLTFEATVTTRSVGARETSLLRAPIVTASISGRARAPQA